MVKRETRIAGTTAATQRQERDISLPMTCLAERICVANDIELRLLTRELADHLAELVEGNRAHLSQWLPWAPYSTSAADSEAFIASENQARLLGDRITLGIFVAGQLVGVVSYHHIDWASREAVIGYWITESRQGAGIVTESCERLVGYGFVELGLARVVIRCATENIRSRAVAERLGFRREAILRNSERVSERVLDQFVYVFLARIGSKNAA